MAIKITTNESILLETKGCKCEEDVEIIVEGNTAPVWDKKISNYVEEVLISFTINGTTYQAEEGMTWGEWCNSSYNTYGYVKSSSSEYISANVGHDYVAFSDSLVESDDVIINNRNYTHHDIGTGGSN